MKEEDMKIKKIIIGVLCAVVCIMVVGFAAFSTNLNISGTSSIESNWSIEFTNIQELSKTEGITNNNPPTASGTTATFDVDLRSPGDSIEYQITVENKGTLDAIIESINASETESDAIKFEISNIRVGDKLAKKTQTTFNIKISYDESITSQPEITHNKLTVTIDYVQDVGQVITPSDPEIQGPIELVAAIFRDNNTKDGNSLNFSRTSAEDGTKGLYHNTRNTENNQVTFYYRGAVDNNYVSFAGFYWRIIRINEDGSIRLIYQGTTPDATGSDASIGDSYFNPNNRRVPVENGFITIRGNGLVGYMYGTYIYNSATYEETHANTNDSAIKTALDAWYEGNLLGYTSYLADAGFCGDRSIASEAGLWDADDTALGYGDNNTYYGSYNRLENEYQPQFACPQENDLYTTTSSDKGNKALDYPIGLITADEVAYAGGVFGETNTSYYLYTGEYYHTMSLERHSVASYMQGISSDGYFLNTGVSDNIGVRPVINLKSTVEITTGDGTISNPYVINV